MSFTPFLSRRQSTRSPSNFGSNNQSGPSNGLSIKSQSMSSCVGRMGDGFSPVNTPPRRGSNRLALRRPDMFAATAIDHALCNGYAGISLLNFRGRVGGAFFPRGNRRSYLTQPPTRGSFGRYHMEGPLTQDLLERMDAYWRAANYLSVGQIYLYDNPLLKKPLTIDHIKPRLLGHWGTTPGLNFIYVHLNRVIRERDVDMIYVCGPGHGGPGIVANTYLEGTYSEIYPNISEDEAGLKKLFKQFSFP